MVVQHTEAVERVGLAAYRVMFECALEGVIFSTPEGRIVAANPAACEMLAYSEAELCRIGRDGVLDLEDPRLALNLAERARSGEASGALRFRRGDGRCVDIEVTTKGFTDPTGQDMSFVILHDVTGRLATEKAIAELTERLHELTLADELTGLRNRRGLEVDGTLLLQLADRQDVAVQALLIEVDNLVSLNAELGHHGGDAALQAVARAMSVAFRKTDVLARITGRQFFALAFGLREVDRAAIVTRLRQHLRAAETTAVVGAEVEVALGWVSRRPGDIATLEQLTARADWALRESMEATLAVGRSHWRNRTPRTTGPAAR
jgi:diguanylate cyclase (GGDEF)-like protein/PAS domain S-box-containing protein